MLLLLQPGTHFLTPGMGFELWTSELNWISINTVDLMVQDAGLFKHDYIIILRILYSISTSMYNVRSYEYYQNNAILHHIPR